MIQANELRIGNRLIRELRNTRGLEYDHEFILNEEWMGKLFGDNIGVALQDLFPIPLTEEWLLKFGFEINKDRDSESCSFDYMYKGLFYIGQFNNEGWLLDAFDSMPPMKHVHQLQNLYFALNGEEIEFKPQHNEHR